MGDEKTTIGFDEIWAFIEKNLKQHIPTYFKNVLKVCGYNNGITIASIGDEDIKYIEGEVRNGNVLKYFKGVDEKTVLKDCTVAATDFTFKLCHKKWLMTIVDFLKKYMEDNGPDSFTIEENALRKLKKKPVIEKKAVQKLAFSRKRKFSETDNLVESIIAEKGSMIDESQCAIDDAGKHIKIVLKKTLEKTIMSLTKPPFTPEMFVKNVESVKARISNGSIRLNVRAQKVKNVPDESTEESKNTSILEGGVYCFLCSKPSKPIVVFHKPTETNFFVWNTSNFDRHLKNMHLIQADNTETNTVQNAKSLKEAVKTTSEKINNPEINCTITSGALMLEKPLNQIDNIHTDIVQEEDAKIIRNREVNCTITSGAFVLEKSMNEADNDTDTDVVQEQDAIPCKRVLKQQPKIINKLELDREVNCTITSGALMLEKSMNQAENIHADIVHAMFRKRALKEQLKAINHREVNCTITSEPKALVLGKSSNEISNVKLGPSIVFYSDTSGESEDDQDCQMLTSRDHILNHNIANGASLNMPADIEDCIDLKPGNAVENITIFRNGSQSEHQNKTIITHKTCAFDSIFAVYVCIYFDNPNFRKHLDVTNLFVHSKFTSLVHSYFEFFSTSIEATSSSELAWKKLYNDRNIILNDIYNTGFYKDNKQMTNVGDITYINCETGIGRLYAQLCREMSEIIGSVIENKVCINCDMIKGRTLPLLKVNIADLDLKNIQKSIGLVYSKDQICMDCKENCELKRFFNNILTLDLEPNAHIKNQKKISLEYISPVINVGKLYRICAVIEYDPTRTHFIAHVKRKNCEWKAYDDLKFSETNSDDSKEILPYMIFYITDSFTNDFKTSLQGKTREMSNFESDEIRKATGNSKNLIPGNKQVADKNVQLKKANPTNQKHSIQTNSKHAKLEKRKRKALEILTK